MRFYAMLMSLEGFSMAFGRLWRLFWGCSRSVEPFLTSFR